MQQVYTPVLVSLEPCIHPHRLGREKVFAPGKSFTGRVWLINDHYEEIRDAALSWKVTDLKTGEVLAGNAFHLDILPDSAEIPDHIVLPLKEEWDGHRCRVDMRVVKDMEVLSENWSHFTIAKEAE